MKNHYHIFLYLSHSLYKAILTLWQFHGCSVISFRLKAVRQSGKDYNYICARCRFTRLFQILFCHLVTL